MCLHADRVDDSIRSAPLGEVLEHVGDLVDVAHVDHLGAPRAGEVEAVVDEVDRDDAAHPAVQRTAQGELADGAEPEHGEGVVAADVGVVHRLPGRREDVGEVEEALVGQVARQLDGAEVGVRHPDALRLSAGHGAVEARVAEEAGALALRDVLGGLALGEEATLAHPAAAARDVEGHDDAIAGLEGRDVGAHLLDDAHELVTQHVTGLQVGSERPVEVQVGAADRGGGDADDGVGGLLDDGIGYLGHTDVLDAVPGECSHDH